jgi:hypothetical protein
MSAGHGDVHRLFGRVTNALRWFIDAVLLLSSSFDGHVPLDPRAAQGRP